MEISRTGITLGIGAVGLVFVVSAQAADRSAVSAASETAGSTTAPLTSAAPSAEPSPSSESDVVDQSPTPEKSPTPEPTSSTDFESEMNNQIRLTQDFAATLIGMNVVEAEALAKSKGFISRITERDGESFIVTMDYRTNRVNLIVENDIITKTFVG
jgi:hypothetical protein